jgi:LDH2 family malate/lactate/ureidoglycolate dehydrogenase
MTPADSDASAPDATVVEAPRLRQFTQLLFEKAGLRSADAYLLADHLNWADRRGISWLGVNKIPQYLERLRTRCTPADAELSIVSDLPGFVLIDGHDAFGQVVGYHAMKAAMAKARTMGAAVAVVRNTTSAGALGYFAALAADEQMIGLAINNSPPLQPAIGGTAKVVGNQAFAVGSPAAAHSPLVLDMATSAITLARIHDYDNRGEPLPEDVALGADGAPTTDPAAALRGTLLPMAGHRGFGLALVWEVLTGVLAGGPRFSRNVTGPDEFDRPQGVSMFLLAVDPAPVMPHNTFTERVDQLIDQVKAPGSTGSKPVRVPGEHSDQIRAERDQHGIPVPAKLFVRLQALGAELGVTL